MESIERITNLLPTPPDNYEYSIEQVSPLVIRVWLHHPPYNYRTEPVRTVYCFIKGNKVYPPKNWKSMRPRSLCSVDELFTCPPYTTIIPKVTSLLHLL